MHYFCRLQKLEEEKTRREHKFRLEQTILENQRRREEREHEMHVLQLLMGYRPERHTQDYTTHQQQQQQQPITNNNMYACETTIDSHFPNIENSSLGSSFSGYGCVSTSSNANPNSYFEM